MAKKNLRLDELIDGQAVRETLTAFARSEGNDGSSPAVRKQVLKRLKEVSEAGRAKARDLSLIHI